MLLVGMPLTSSVPAVAQMTRAIAGADCGSLGSLVRLSAAAQPNASRLHPYVSRLQPYVSRLQAFSFESRLSPTVSRCCAGSTATA